MVSSIINLPTVKMCPKPLRLTYMRPKARPSGWAAIEGQTVMIVTSPRSGGATPAIACFMAEKPKLRMMAPREKQYQEMPPNARVEFRTLAAAVSSLRADRNDGHRRGSRLSQFGGPARVGADVAR